jgi:hypothetical protein
MSKDNEPEKISRHIIPALTMELNTYSPAISLRQTGIERILGRRIVAWSHSLGSYGMGGPGFFGLRLAAAHGRPGEWLVQTLWGADNWQLFDGRWVAAHPNQYHVQRPLVSYFGGDEDWDDLSPMLVDSTIVDAEIVDNASLIELEKDSVLHRLEIPADTTLLPLYGGVQKTRAWIPEESQLDAWVFSSSGDLIV